MNRVLRAGVIAVLVASVVLVVPGAPAVAAATRPGLSGSTQAAEITGPVGRVVTRRLPFAADHVALYWRGHPDATVTAAFSRDGTRFGPAVDVGRDEVGEQRYDGNTYGGVLATAGAVFVRVRTTEPIRRLTALGLRDKARDALAPLISPETPVAGAAQPSIVARSGWGADESLRFHSDGRERWTPTFHPVQKLIVHHTAGANNDRNPSATIRAIYHYHAVTQRWGDIGYNFLIDDAGRIYKGRHSHAPGSAADTVTGEDSTGKGVTGAHARDYNAGTVGVALLGTFTNQDATPAAKRALEDLLAWKAHRHGIDPRASPVYTNPTNGRQRSFPNIAGHRDVGTTQCPGGTFYAGLPDIRQRVAARTGG